jgi:hypothetical protein
VIEANYEKTASDLYSWEKRELEQARHQKIITDAIVLFGHLQDTNDEAAQTRYRTVRQIGDESD